MPLWFPHTVYSFARAFGGFYCGGIYIYTCTSKQNRQIFVLYIHCILYKGYDENYSWLVIFYTCSPPAYYNIPVSGSAVV